MIHLRCPPLETQEECQRQLELRRRGLKAAERDVKADGLHVVRFP